MPEGPVVLMLGTRGQGKHHLGEVPECGLQLVSLGVAVLSVVKQ